jgi:hypothetical protein
MGFWRCDGVDAGNEVMNDAEGRAAWVDPYALWIRAVTQAKDGKAQRSETVGVVELLAAEIFPKLQRVLWHLALARCRRDKYDERRA